MKIFYGWFIVAIAFVCYGFGISPAYYSWGFYTSLLVESDPDFTRTDLGFIFGIFTFMYSAVGPLVGYLQNKFSVRKTMAVGSVIAALGFLIVSLSESKIGFFIGFSLLGGGGVGLSTIIPAQTLGQNWFLKRRALAVAIIMCAGGIVGKLVPKINTWVANTFADNPWQAGWVVVACISLAVGLIAALFVRDTPEQMGMVRDGDPPEPKPIPDVEVKTNEVLPDPPPDPEHTWGAWEAILTPQFLLITLAGIGYATPWGVFIPHGVTHFTEMGFERSVAASFIGTAALVSILGRLFGMAGDTINPRYVIIGGLLLEGLGMLGLIVAKSVLVANISAIAIGIGFGSTYIGIPVLFSAYFGRKAFGTTAGTRMLITGVFNGAGPIVTGIIADRVGYTFPFIGLALLAWLGAFATFICKPPGPPPSAEKEPETA